MRIERNCAAVLEMLAEADVLATFFASGQVAKRYPALMRRIAGAGHELASHGWDHAHVFTMDRASFRLDLHLQMSRKTIEDTTGIRVIGYRAPGFSIDQRTPWAFTELAEQGFAYSSSVAPIASDLDGWREAPRFAFRPVPRSDLVEIPVTTATFAGRRLAAGTGGFFRVLPYGFTRWAICQVNRREGRPAVFCFDLQEIGPRQLRVPAGTLRSKLRLFTSRDDMTQRLRQLIGEFHWGRMDVLAAREAAMAMAMTS
jgi:polysaccharide deacetylase family protein (PEP-CTERM system associated)